MKEKLISSMFFKTVDERFAKEPDMTGPLFLAVILGLTLVLVVISLNP